MSLSHLGRSLNWDRSKRPITNWIAKSPQRIFMGKFLGAAFFIGGIDPKENPLHRNEHRRAANLKVNKASPELNCGDLIWAWLTF